MAVQEQISITEPIVAYEFIITNHGDANTTAKTPEPSSNEYLLPWEGSIVGISAVSNAAFTGTNTETYNPTIDGVTKTGIGCVTSNAIQQAYATKPVGVVAFAAGKRLGVLSTKTGTVAPTTNDIVITVYVQFKNVFTAA